MGFPLIFPSPKIGVQIFFLVKFLKFTNFLALDTEAQKVSLNSELSAKCEDRMSRPG